jgi:hypothetical protein
MNLPRTAMTCLVGMVAGAVVVTITLAPALTQTNRTSTFDPVSAFVGTWTATKPNESIPFLTLKLRESGGKLIGTMSHFKIGVVGTGRIVGSRVIAAESPVSDLTVSEGEVGFVWSGDPPLRGGQVGFVVQGTKVAYLLIPVSDEEMKKIMSDSPGASGFIPIIWMRRKPEAGNEKQQESSVEKWEITTAASLINAAEFQYKFANGVYADYSTLLRSGELQKTGGRQFTLVPKNLQSATDPLPGYLLRLLVSPDRSAYQFSIQDKTSADCASALFSDETGVIFDGHTLGCSGN